MPKNTGRGGKGFRSGKKQHNNDPVTRMLVLKEEGQDYAKVLKMLGNRRLSVLCNDGKTRLAIIPGSFKNKVWINNDDFILISVRGYQDDKVDVIYKYTADEGRQLGKFGHLSENLCKEERKDHKIEFISGENDKNLYCQGQKDEGIDHDIKFEDL